MHTFRYVALLLALVLGSTASGQETQPQDTALLLNGKQLIGSQFAPHDSLQQYTYTDPQGRPRLLNYDELYAIARANGQTTIVYAPDSTQTDALSVADMHQFVLGAQEARRSYRGNAYLWGGAAVGLGSVFLMPALGLPTYTAPLLAIGAGVAATRIKLPEPQNPPSTYYTEGYKYTTERIRNRKLFLGLGLGLAAGIAITLSGK